MIVASDALSNLLDVWDEYTVADLGPHLTCAEADALADLFRVIGAPNMAEALIEGHAYGDDAGDAHHYEGYNPHGDGCDNCGGEDHACDTCPDFTAKEQYDAHVREDHK